MYLCVKIKKPEKMLYFLMKSIQISNQTIHYNRFTAANRIKLVNYYNSMSDSTIHTIVSLSMKTG